MTTEVFSHDNRCFHLIFLPINFLWSKLNRRTDLLTLGPICNGAKHTYRLNFCMWGPFVNKSMQSKIFLLNFIFKFRLWLTRCPSLFIPGSTTWQNRRCTTQFIQSLKRDKLISFSTLSTSFTSELKQKSPFRKNAIEEKRKRTAAK